MLQRIFIASTSDDLAAHRDRVSQAVLRLHGVPLAMEYMGARPYPPIIECQRVVENCDALIVLVAHRYGWVPSPAEGGDGHRSITWIETDAALQVGKPIFAFLVDPTACWCHGKEQDQLLRAAGVHHVDAAAVARRVAALGEFRSWIDSCPIIRETFTTPEDLAEKVSTSLAAWLLDTSTATGTKRPPASAQTPDAPPGLPTRGRCVGRTAQHALVVHRLLADRPLPIPVLGTPGIGKTALALDAAHDPRVEACYRERRFFVSADAIETANVLRTRVAVAFGLPTDATSSRNLRRRIGTKRTLLLLDGLDHPWEHDTIETERFLSELADISRLAILATIRGHERPLNTPWDDSVVVSKLELPAARDLFLQIAGSKFSEDDKLAQILSDLDGWPLGIKLIAFIAQGQPTLATVWAEWKRKRLDLLEAPRHDRPTGAATCFRAAIEGRRMTEGARRLLRILGTLPDGISESVLQIVLHDSVSNSAFVLRRVGLIDAEATNLRILTPVRSYVSQVYPPFDDDLARLVSYYCDIARDGEHAQRLIQSEFGNVIAVFRMGLERLSPQAPIDAILTFADNLGPMPHLLSLVREAHAVADRKGHSTLAAKCGGLLADRLIPLRAFDEAESWLDRVQPLFERTADGLGIARCLYSRGVLALARLDPEAARALFSRAKAYYEKCNDTPRVAECLRGFADAASQRSEWTVALEFYQEAETRFRHRRDMLGIAACLAGKGYVKRSRREFDSAKNYYGTARAHYRSAGDIAGQARCLFALGEIAHHERDWDRANMLLQLAVRLYSSIGDDTGQGLAYRLLASIASTRSPVDAATFETRADDLLRKAGHVELVDTPIRDADRMSIDEGRERIE